MCTKNDIFPTHQSQLQISISFFNLDMDKKRQPNTRFSQFQELLNQQGKPIGFKIPGCDFVFTYDKSGGWLDQKGFYYNADGVLQSDDQDQHDDQFDNDDEDDELSLNDDEVIDQFQDLLRRQEEGISRKKTQKKVEEQPKEAKSDAVKNPKKPNDQRDFKGLIQKYVQKQLLKENLPGELFIYFKQREQYFVGVKPQVQGQQSVDEKNKLICSNLKLINQYKEKIVNSEKWLSEPGVFLDFSGDSPQSNQYDRYWFGYIKTTPDKYLELLENIRNSKAFKLLQVKTFYALKSKFYLKKSEQKLRNRIKQLTETFNSLLENEVIFIKLDNLPENFPLSFIYDLVEYAGGRYQDIQQAHIIDQFSAQLSVLKPTALKIANLQAYNHDKGQFIEIIVKQKKPRVSNPQKRFYFIQVDGPYKIHQRQLYDTLALTNSKEQVAKLCTKTEYEECRIRFAVGSENALKKVLMFRGESLNINHIYPKIPSK